VPQECMLLRRKRKTKQAETAAHGRHQRPPQSSPSKKALWWLGAGRKREIGLKKNLGGYEKWRC
jgi:hypothetical protein